MVYLPSIASLKALRKRPHTKGSGAVVFADPIIAGGAFTPLPYAREEARMIGNLLPETLEWSTSCFRWKKDTEMTFTSVQCIILKLVDFVTNTHFHIDNPKV